MKREDWIDKTEDYVRESFLSDSTGHDWWHISRVRNMASVISETEGGDKFVIEISALLHDLDDWKINSNEDNRNTINWLRKLSIPKDLSKNIIETINQVSYKGSGVATPANSIEAKVVQDADRLDAIGAVGIARAFAYGGSKGRLIYDPSVAQEIHKDFKAYKSSTAPTINHFYEKLFLLKERMHTDTARKMAETRHLFMEDYLEQFFSEWNTEK